MLKIFIFVLISLFSSCFPDESRKIIFVPLADKVSTLDPINSYDTISASVVYQAHEQLYQYHYLKRPYTIEPLLAEGMPQVLDGGKKYVIKIKKNVSYHDDPVFKGKPRYLKAQDFILQFKRLAFKPKKSNGWWFFDGKIKGLNQFRTTVGNDFNKLFSEKVSGLRAPDDHTLVIELTRPYPQMLYWLAMSFISPVPKELVLEYKNNFDARMIGTGPFIFKNWEKGKKITFIKNFNYHDQFYPSQGDRLSHSRQLFKDAGKKLPFLDELHFHISEDATQRWKNFISKKLHFLVLPRKNHSQAIDTHGDLKKELKDRNITLNVSPTLTYWWLSFNMKDPLVGQNRNLRLAIAHAINLDKYVKIFTNNVGQKANSIYPPGIEGYSPSKNLPYEYNIDKAKSYLKKAGHPNGEGLPIITFDLRGKGRTNADRGLFIKEQLGKIGIKVKPILNTFPEFLLKSKLGKLQFWQDGWALDYPDAENILQLLTSSNHPPGPNVSFYHNPDFDKVYSQIKQHTDPSLKKDLLNKAEEYIHHDLPWIMQNYTRNYILIHPTLKNYRNSDIIYNYIKYLKI